MWDDDSPVGYARRDSEATPLDHASHGHRQPVTAHLRGTFSHWVARRERRQFARLLAVMAPVTALLGVWNLSAGAGFGDAASSRSGVLLLVYAAILVVAWRMAHHGGIRPAARMTAGALLALNLALAAVVPAHSTAIVLLPLMAMAIAMPYVGRRELAVLIVIAWIECVGSAALGMPGGPLGSAPEWFTQARRLTGAGVVIAVILFLIWHFKVRSSETLAAIGIREEAAQVARARYRGLFDGNPVGLFRASADGTILDANPALARALAVEGVDDLIGRSQAWFTPDLLAEAISHNVRGRDVEIVRADGTSAWLRLSVRALAGSSPVVLEGSAEDITEHHQTEERLLHAMKLDSVGRLAGGVAHDFNNLLTTIRGFASVLDAELDASDPRRDSVFQISRAADRAALLTAQLLAVGRRQMLQPAAVDLNALIDDLVPSIRRVLGNAIEVCVPPGPNVALVSADAAQIERVVVNLAMNARDAMPDGGTLTLATTDLELAAPEADVPAGDWVVLTVTDTGHGMTDETRRRAFEPFFTTKSDGRGTGLGLATVYGVVVQSGGHLALDTRVGQGTTFRILLPRLAADATAIAVPAEAVASLAPAELVAPAAMVQVVVPAVSTPAADPVPTPHRLIVAAASVVAGTPGRETIMLVEDDYQVLALTTRILTRQGYQVVAFNSSVAALAIDDERLDSIHLIVSDVVMPVIDGPTVVHELSIRRPGLSHLFVSGYAETTILEEGLRVGKSFLAKPYSADALLGRVRELLAVAADAAA